MKLKKPKFWDESKFSLWVLFLYPISILYLIFSFFLKIKKSKKYSVPIICVGNIYLGGTGKTPLVKEIFQITKSLGKNPAFIKKYYNYVEDEINMLKKIGKTYSNKKRENSLELLIKDRFNLAILDDGFQDSSIKKNINILCFNQKQWIGNGFVMPAGPLRESFSNINKADCIFINGQKDIGIEKKLYEENRNVEIYYSKYRPIEIEKFKGKKICGFAGIGNPSNFFDLLEENNLNLIKTFSFPDHHNYSYSEISNMFKKCNDCELVTTEKDYFRIAASSIPKGFQIQFLKVELEIENKGNFIKLIKDKI